MEISSLSKLDSLVEVVDPMYAGNQDTYLGFAVRSQDIPFLMKDIEDLVRHKYSGATYADLLDEDIESVRLAAIVSSSVV